MRRTDKGWNASPTDLANFLVCRHKTALDASVASGELAQPDWRDPVGELLRELGIAHERRQIEILRQEGKSIEDLEGVPLSEAEPRLLNAMNAGVEVIVQAPLRGGIWSGYADTLRRVDDASTLGPWSYEVHDTKLARETRGGTILQLCVYTELVGALQGRVPERFHVVSPVTTKTYRFEEFAAYYRLVKERFSEFIGIGGEPPYPESLEHCAICRWWKRCNDRRRQDDHLCFVAGMGRLQQAELQSQGIGTMVALAATPIPLNFEPARGARETYERLREQARLQVRQRDTGHPNFELLWPAAKGPYADPRSLGIANLPLPSSSDIFLDLEGDPFAREGGREYLFGLGQMKSNGIFTYVPRWALTDDDERTAFEGVVDEITEALKAHPDAHVYHYAPYEPVALKRLMGRYASRDQALDALLRGARFVDLYSVIRHTFRAGIENYSIKSLEPFYGFSRAIGLDLARDQRRVVEAALELNHPASVTAQVRAAVEGYNKDDCRSTFELRAWLEKLREDVAAQVELPRPGTRSGEASESVSERQRAVATLRTRLLEDLPPLSAERSDDQQARYLLAYMLDWHRREDKVAWWDYFRLLTLDDEDLYDEPTAVCGLKHLSRVHTVLHKKTNKPTGSVVDRYIFPPQEMELRRGNTLRLQDESTFGSVEAVDRVERTIDVRKGPSKADCHPTSAFTHERVPPETPESALFRIGEHAAQQGVVEATRYKAGLYLLARRPPVIGGVELAKFQRDPGETEAETCVRVACDLRDTAFPIQGPPGSGKTHTGAQMICELVKHGRRVGVTATSHKVIRKLLDDVFTVAGVRRDAVRLGHRVNDIDNSATSIEQLVDNEKALGALAAGNINVLGGTVWLWGDERAEGTIDVLFVDEAGQMSLANVLAASQAADSIVLLGDPRQLEQPQRGSHPDGVEVSALSHVLGEQQTMSPGLGIFLPTTWRLAPAITEFTSRLFYEGRLRSKRGLEHQRLDHTGTFDGAGLWFVPVKHTGNHSFSTEEVAVVAAIIDRLLRSESVWFSEDALKQRLAPKDILVLSPFNAQVTRLQEVLAARGVAIGTVDKFQGQEAPVAIYSMATSRAEDAPHGMEFLYSLNRLNVATSRPRCAAIVVASPLLLEPECNTPRQMTLANALCYFKEMAKVVHPTSLE